MTKKTIHEFIRVSSLNHLKNQDDDIAIHLAVDNLVGEKDLILKCVLQHKGPVLTTTGRSLEGIESWILLAGDIRITRPDITLKFSQTIPNTPQLKLFEDKLGVNECRFLLMSPSPIDIGHGPTYPFVHNTSEAPSPYGLNQAGLNHFL